MDHLPLPKNSPRDPVEVPYSCTCDYDGGPMLQYPNRRGWTVRYSPYGILYLDENGVKPTNTKLGDFIQTWLYFGFLHELFGDFADIKSFVTQNSQGKPVVTTAPLQDCLEILLKRWKGDAPSHGPEGKEAVRGMAQLNSFLGRVALNTKSVYRNKEIDDRIWLSIAILSETVARICTNHFMGDVDEGLDDDAVTWRAYGNPTFGQFLVDDMTQNGWCPFDVDRVDKTATSATLLYYLAHLPPPRPNMDHSLCTKDVCTSMTIDSSYETKHTPRDCRCGSEFSDTPSVINALQGEEIPLIQEMIQLKAIEWQPPGAENFDAKCFMEDTDAEPKFRIIQSGKERKYVAISHVWAEGLGNPHGNSLPTCALKWISNHVKLFNFHPGGDESDEAERKIRPYEEALEGKTPFWLDTICVPVSPPDMWKKAMNRLRKPYQDAALVLVLDSYLYTIDSREIDSLEMWARILCCSWSRRLWTFQEARLARPGRLWILFKDTAMSMEDIWHRFSNNIATEELETELHLKWRGSNVLRGLAEMGLPISDTILKTFRAEPDVWDMRESLKARAVSVPEDEVLCLFCNMGLDMELAMNTPEEDRLAVFWRNVKKIPVGLVFSHASKKMTAPGLRWAPTSFLGSLDRFFWYIEQNLRPRKDGFVTEYGLQIQVPALLCDPKLLLWDDSYELLFENETGKFVLRDEENCWYFVEPRDFWNQDRTARPKENERLAILHVQHIEDFDREPTAATGQSTGDPFDFKHSMWAVLGTVEDPASSEGEEGEGSRITDGPGQVLDRPPDTPDPKDLPRFRGYRHLSLHRFSDAMCDYYRAVAVAVELYVALECGTRWYYYDDSGEQVDLMSKLLQQQPETDTSSAKGEEPGGDNAATETTATNSTSGNESEEDGVLAQNLEDLSLGVIEEQSSEQAEAGSHEDTFDQVEEATGSDEESQESDDSGSQASGTDDEDVVKSYKETPETYTLKESSRDNCERFANMFVRFDTRARDITLAVGRNQGRNQEDSYDHFAKSARFQLQMRQRNFTKRLKRETWWIID